jgi:hypothetical protein
MLGLGAPVEAIQALPAFAGGATFPTLFLLTRKRSTIGSDSTQAQRTPGQHLIGDPMR